MSVPRCVAGSVPREHPLPSFTRRSAALSGVVGPGSQVAVSGSNAVTQFPHGAPPVVPYGPPQHSVTFSVGNNASSSDVILSGTSGATQGVPGTANTSQRPADTHVSWASTAGVRNFVPRPVGVSSAAPGSGYDSSAAAMLPKTDFSPGQDQQGMDMGQVQECFINMRVNLEMEKAKNKVLQEAMTSYTQHAFGQVPCNSDAPPPWLDVQGVTQAPGWDPQKASLHTVPRMNHGGVMPNLNVLNVGDAHVRTSSPWVNGQVAGVVQSSGMGPTMEENGLNSSNQPAPSQVPAVPNFNPNNTTYAELHPNQNPQCPKKSQDTQEERRRRHRSNSGSSNDSHAPSVASISTQSARKYRLKKAPLFKGSETPEEFEDFVQLFELHMKSNNCDDKEEWADVLQAFLSGTPRTMYRQLRRDNSRISYDEVISQLRVGFGKPLDPRMALHKIYDVSWNPGESLAQLATRIRDLHYQAHSHMSVRDREICSGDTFYRLMPQDWKKKIRDSKGETISELLALAIECQDRDRELQHGQRKSVRLLGDSSVDLESSGQEPAVVETPMAPVVPTYPGTGYQGRGGQARGRGRGRGGQGGKSPVRCYNCNIEGHISRDCTQPRKYSQPGGATGTSGGPPPVGPQGGGVQQYLTGHQRMVKPSEVSVSRITGLIGRSIEHSVSMEGLSTRAIVDCGSQINIISFEFFLKVADKLGLEEMRRRCQGLQEGIDEFKGFGGKPIPSMHAYLPITVKCGGSKPVSILCVVDEGKNPEGDLLLGSLGMAALGFKVISPSGIDLLSWPEHGAAATGSMSPGVTSVSSKSPTYRVFRVTMASSKVRVRSLGAAPLSLMVSGDLPNPREGHKWFFSADPQFAEEGVGLADCLVKIGPDQKFIVPVSNYGSWPVTLHPEERDIGTLEEVEVLSSEASVPDLSEPGQESDSPSVFRVSKSDLQHRLKVNEALKIGDGEGSEDVRKLCLEFHHIFALTEMELGLAKGVEHRINTGDHPPIAHKCRRLPYALRDKVDVKMGKDKETGKVEDSDSPWAAPIVAVRKPDGDVRVCGDYTDLNEASVKDAYPLRHCHDLLDSVGRTKPKKFSLLDCRSGYNQIAMSEDSRAKTAMIYHGGLVQWRVMPFGLCNAPATFQRLMDKIFKGLPREKIHIYLDDLCIPTATIQDHLEMLREVFLRLEEFGLTLRPDKCHFLMKEVKYLGFIVSEKGLTADPEKTRAVREFPAPRTKTNLKSFLGLASYYRRFVKDFSKIAKPLTDALVGDHKVVVWTIECQVAFDQLKKVLTEAPVLAFPDLSKRFFVESDGSKLGLGAVLAQKDDNGKLRPVAYGSRTLRGAEVRYGSPDLEMLAVVFALKHFKVYIYGTQVTLITDHKNLVDMLMKTTALATDRAERWKQQVRNYEVVVVYRPGAENKAADALSRCPVPDEVDAPVVLRVEAVPANQYQGFSEFDSGFLQKIRTSQRKDSWLKEILAFKEDGIVPQDEKRARWFSMMDSHFHVIEGILFYVDTAKELKLKVVVPESERDHLLWELHYSPLGGHLGMDKVLEKVSRQYYWPKMRQDVQRYLRSCIVCASRSGQGRHCKPPLQPIPAPAEPFEVVASDIVKLSLTRSGNLYALVTTDFLSKFVIVSPMPDMTAETVASVFLKDVLPFGAPAHMLTDQGKQFTSELMRTVCDAFQVKQLFTTTFHPQCDGQTERANQTLEAMLSKCSSVREDDWDVVVPFVAHAYNSSMHASTKDSPYHVLFGRKPRLPSSSVFAVASNYFTIENDDDFRTMLPHFIQLAWESARQASDEAKERQKAQYDKTAKDPPFEVGDKVFVQSKELIRTKLSRRYSGPGVILRKTPTNAVVQLAARRGKKKFTTRKFHLDKLTKAHPEIGDRVFTGNPRHPVEPPSVSPQAGTARSQEGEGSVEVEKEPSKKKRQQKKKSTESNVAPTHSYGLRSRNTLGRVRSVRLSQNAVASAWNQQPFFLCCGVRWRLRFQPVGNAPGASIQKARRPSHPNSYSRPRSSSSSTARSSSSRYD